MQGHPTEKMATLWRPADSECWHLFYPQHQSSGRYTPGFDEWKDLDMDLSFVAEVDSTTLNFTLKDDVSDITRSRCPGESPAKYCSNLDITASTGSQMLTIWHRAQSNLNLIDLPVAVTFTGGSFIFGFCEPESGEQNGLPDSGTLQRFSQLRTRNWRPAPRLCRPASLLRT